MNKNDLPKRWSVILNGYLQNRDQLEIFDFTLERIEIVFEDGSFTKFNDAFCLEDETYQEVCIFTEYNGYHIFNRSSIERIDEFKKVFHCTRVLFMNKMKSSLADIAAILLITICFFLIMSRPIPKVHEVRATPTPEYYHYRAVATPIIYGNPTHNTNYKSKRSTLCKDGTISQSTGRGTCSHHDGVD